MFKGQELFWVSLAVIVVIWLVRALMRRQWLNEIFCELGEIPAEKWATGQVSCGGVFFQIRQTPLNGEMWTLVRMNGKHDQWLLLRTGEQIAACRRLYEREVHEGELTGAWDVGNRRVFELFDRLRRADQMRGGASQPT